MDGRFYGESGIFDWIWGPDSFLCSFDGFGVLDGVKIVEEDTSRTSISRITVKSSSNYIFLANGTNRVFSVLYVPLFRKSRIWRRSF